MDRYYTLTIPGNLYIASANGGGTPGPSTVVPNGYIHGQNIRKMRIKSMRKCLIRMYIGCNISNIDRYACALMISPFFPYATQ